MTDVERPSFSAEHLVGSPADVGLRGRAQSPQSDTTDHVRRNATDHVRALVDVRPVRPSVGLYVHVPFCTKRCYFCSFNTAPMDDEAMERYLRALHREIDLVRALPWADVVTLESVFFGGGTPSLLGAHALVGILDRLRARFPLAPGAEVTVESNPESLDLAKLRGYRAAGVNRISLGVQTLDDGILPVIGRLHDSGGARAAFEACRAAGFDNVSVDLMYGLPGLDVEGWTRSVRAVLDWHPDHLSAYGLTLDSGSLWGASGVSGLPAEDTVIEQYWALAREAGTRGFEHYEVSNYARPGKRSHHNQVYWRRREYLALGPGACGFVGDVRYANAKALARYAGAIEEGRLPVDSAETLTPAQALAERLILGLRTSDGVARADLEARTASDAALRARLEQWGDAGLLDRGGERVRLTERGFLVSDALFVELL
jgi:oxygen-independent coproporphyrinogen-3 oxidase